MLEAEGQLSDWLARVEEVAKNKRSSQPLIDRVLPNEQKEKEIKKQAVEELKRGN